MSSGLVFYDVWQEGQRLQFLVSRRATGIDAAAFKQANIKIRPGDIIACRGHPGKTDAGELSLFACDVAEILAPSLHSIPFKSHDTGHELHKPTGAAQKTKRYLEMLVSPATFVRFKKRAQVKRRYC